MARKHQAEEHFERIESLVLAGFRWPEIAAKLAKETGVKASANSLQLFYSRRKARILRRLKEDEEEVALRAARARAQALEDMKVRGRALEEVSVAPGVKPTQAPASRQAEKPAVPQVDRNAIFASALESLESQRSARIIP